MDIDEQKKRNSLSAAKVLIVFNYKTPAEKKIAYIHDSCSC